MLFLVVPFYMGGCAATGSNDVSRINIQLLDNWSGDYPVAELNRLPEGQQDKPVGYINEAETFIPVWRAFMPGAIIPEVDFRKNIVVFTRNIRFYNRKTILKVELEEGTAEIIAMETMSARPIEEKVAMAMAVIPRQGVTAIRAGTERTLVQGP